MPGEFENPIEELRKEVVHLNRPLSMIDTQLGLLHQEGQKVSARLASIARDAGEIRVSNALVLLVLLLILWRVW